jgi:hypothetical protein
MCGKNNPILPSVIIQVKGKTRPFLAGKSSRGVLSKIVKKKRKRKEKEKKGTVRPKMFITVSSVTTVPGRRAKFIAREQEKIKKGMRR